MVAVHPWFRATNSVTDVFSQVQIAERRGPRCSAPDLFNAAQFSRNRDGCNRLTEQLHVVPEAEVRQLQPPSGCRSPGPSIYMCHPASEFVEPVHSVVHLRLRIVLYYSTVTTAG